jgi:hypothetical protein
MLSRVAFLALAIATIALGLVVHLHGTWLVPRARDLAGDALWGAMVVWLAGAAAPRARLVVRSAAAWFFCVVLEVSQLYHSTALDAVRRTLAGHLVLGRGFDPRDLVAYAVGVLAAATLEAALRTAKS